MIDWETPKYGGEIPYPLWGVVIGWVIVVVKLGLIPILGLAAVIKYAMKGVST